MPAPDFIAHPTHGLARLSQGQKAHLFMHMCSARVSLSTPVAARYLRDWADDDENPPVPAAPAQVSL